MRAHGTTFLLIVELAVIGGSGFVAGYLWPHPGPELTLAAPTAPVIETTPMESLDEPTTQIKPEAEEQEAGMTARGQFVASKSGAKYHPATGCSYADRIKEENRIYFNTAKEAESAGYEPSSCIENN